MNDDEKTPIQEDATSTTECDSTSAQDPCTEKTASDRELDATNFSLSDHFLQDSDPNPDSDPAASAAIGSGNELEQLRGELKALRSELNAREALWSRLGIECEEFQNLYPETPLASLDETIWNEVRRGVPIAAAFALSERKRLRTAEIAEQSNLLNRQRSSGAVVSGEDEYFSPTEVRAMSASEVRSNYQKIMKSMKSWH